MHLWGQPQHPIMHLDSNHLAPVFHLIPLSPLGSRESRILPRALEICLLFYKAQREQNKKWLTQRKPYSLSKSLEGKSYFQINNLLFHIFKDLFLFKNIFISLCVCTTCVQEPTEARGHEVPWNWSSRQLWVTGCGF